MIHVAILGFGVVGSGTAEVLTMNKESIEKKVGDTVNIKYILDLRDFPDSPFSDKIVHDYEVILSDPEVSVIAEVMGGSHPAYEFSVKALEAGKNVVTSNKEVVANFGRELLACAAEHGVRYLFEASVGGGIPVLSPIMKDLSANKITKVAGILNGTTNYILTQMLSLGKSFDIALREAQAKGYAEANPSADVDGIDACRKICILAALAFGKVVDTKDITTEGITKIRSEDVAFASNAGYAIKLIGYTEEVDGKIAIMVSPRLIERANMLANINDVFNGIAVSGNAVNEVMFYGPGAGKLPTASAVVADMIDIMANRENKSAPIVWERAEAGDLYDMNEYVCRRFVCAKDASEKALGRAFGKPLYISTKGNETAIITEPMSEKALADACAASGANIISTLRVL